MELKKISLATIGAGALEERFQEALQDVVSNIVNPNMPENKTREIVIKITVVPATAERDAVGFKFSVSPKLADQVPVTGIMYVGRESGDLALFEKENPNQLSLLNINASGVFA